MAQAPCNTAAIAIVGEGIGNERPRSRRRNLKDRHHTEIEAVGGILDGVLLGPIEADDRGNTPLPREQAGLMTGIQHRVQRRLLEGAKRMIGDSYALGPNNGSITTALAGRALVVEEYPALVDQRERVMDGIAVPFAGFAEVDHSPSKRTPRAIGRIGLGNGGSGTVALQAGNFVKALIIEVILAAPYKHIGRRYGPPAVFAPGGTLDRRALLGPLKAVLAGCVPYLRQVPVGRRDRIGGILGSGRPRLGLAIRVPDVICAADLEDLCRIAAGIAFVV